MIAARGSRIPHPGSRIAGEHVAQRSRTAREASRDSTMSGRSAIRDRAITIVRMSSRALRRLSLAALTLACLGVAAQSAAQEVPAEEQPIGKFAADVRGTFPKFKQDAGLAADLGVSTANLPTRAFGIVAGAHWYPARIRRVTLGVGGEMVVARRGHTLAPSEEGGPDGPTVNSRFASVSPQVSLNIGSRDGWSYISGGMGSSTFTAERADAPLPPQEGRSRTINYGGGARWFSKKHLALSLDLRFYSIDGQEATASRPAVPHMRLFAFSVGAAFK
jgi:hypothetical protein